MKFVRYARTGMNTVRQELIGGAFRHAPERYGIWVFTFGYESPYFYAQQMMTKAGYPEGKEFAEIKRRIRRVIEWDGPVWANINAKGEATRHPDFGGEWNYFPEAKMYEKAMQKSEARLKAMEKSSPCKYSRDHLECFLPGHKF